MLMLRGCCRTVTRNSRFLIAATERSTKVPSCVSLHNHFNAASAKRHHGSTFSNNSPFERLTDTSLKRHLHLSKLRFAAEEIQIGEHQCVSLEELKKGLANDGVLLIDIRRQDEVDSGTIPSNRFIHIPVDRLAEALQMTNSDFKTIYGTDKPATDADDIVFYCRSGRRSGLALGIVQPLGYSKSRHFAGGWLEWSAEEG